MTSSKPGTSEPGNFIFHSTINNAVRNPYMHLYKDINIHIYIYANRNPTIHNSCDGYSLIWSSPDDQCYLWWTCEEYSLSHTRKCVVISKEAARTPKSQSSCQSKLIQPCKPLVRHYRGRLWLTCRLWLASWLQLAIPMLPRSPQGPARGLRFVLALGTNDWIPWIFWLAAWLHRRHSASLAPRRPWMNWKPRLVLKWC